MKKQIGFTLIELMIVMAIIGILAAVTVPAYQDYGRKQMCGNGNGLVGNNPNDAQCVEWNKKLSSQRNGTTPAVIQEEVNRNPIPQPTVIVVPPTTTINPNQPMLPTPATPAMPAAKNLNNPNVDEAWIPGVSCQAGYTFVDKKQLISANGGGVPCITQ